MIESLLVLVVLVVVAYLIVKIIIVIIGLFYWILNMVVKPLMKIKRKSLFVPVVFLIEI